MSIDRTEINEHWCEFHWSPYRSRAANGIYACVALVKAILTRPEFRESVERKIRVYGMTHMEAADLALADLLQRHRKPLCCIVGDSIMANILVEARGPLPQIPNIRSHLNP